MIDTRGAFREGFARHRRLVPADGSYDISRRTASRPIWFHREDSSGLILLAGLYESWFPGKNQPQMTFTIVTNGVIAPIHDRSRWCSMSAAPTTGCLRSSVIRFRSSDCSFPRRMIRS